MPQGSERRGPGRKRLAKAGGRRLTAVVLIVPLTTMVSHAFGRTGLPLLLPAIKDDLDLNNSRAGVASTILFSSYLLGVVIVTLFARRIEPLTTLLALLSADLIQRSGAACTFLGFVIAQRKTTTSSSTGRSKLTVLVTPCSDNEKTSGLNKRTSRR